MVDVLEDDGQGVEVAIKVCTFHGQGWNALEIHGVLDKAGEVSMAMDAAVICEKIQAAPQHLSTPPQTDR